MPHEPEADAARFLGADMEPGEREEFGRHLLQCAPCWEEVDAARRGRAALEAARTVAPAALRERLRVLVDAEPAGPAAGWSSRLRAHGRWQRWRRALPVAVPVAAAAVGVALVLSGPPEPLSLREAVADYAAGRLPGADLPETSAPDLSALRLRPVGAGGGSYAGLDVDGFAYRDPAGRQVVLYLSDEPFPEAPGADRLDGVDGAWLVQRDDVVVLCARVPHGLLVVGRDGALVREAAGVLGVL